MFNNKKNNDWRCVDCNYNNFASNDKCRECGCFRSKSLKSNNNNNNEMKQGDWLHCNIVNFASRMACMKCGKNKSDIPDQQPVSKVNTVNIVNSKFSMKPGDWKCTSCNDINFASRTICRKCNKPNTIDAHSSNTNNVNQDQIVKSDTVKAEKKTCIICMDRDINTVIKTCGHLGYCFECAFSMPKCPLCQVQYDPDKDLLKVFMPN